MLLAVRTLVSRYSDYAGQAGARAGGISAAAVVGSGGGGADAMRKGPQRMQPLAPFAKQVGRRRRSRWMHVRAGPASICARFDKGEHHMRLHSRSAGFYQSITP